MILLASYQLSCCSTVDVSLELLEKRDIAHVCFNYILNGTTYKDDFGVSNTPEQLYSRMLAGESATTSQVAVGDYITHFRSILDQGKDILHLTLSSGISGTINSAQKAMNLLAPEYPDRKIYVIDSLAASAGYGFLMDKLADLRDEGMGIDEARDWVLAHRLEVNHLFISTDLTFFVKGGRISKAAGAFGGLLKICPLMDVEPDGSLAVKEKIRTKARAKATIVDRMAALAAGGEDYDGKVYISQSTCMEDARDVADAIEARFPKMQGKVEIFPIGATIGVHTGPGTVALFFWGAPRQ